MSIELRVTGRRQDTPNSCWWACMAVVLDYYGRHYDRPEQFRQEFRRPAATRFNPYERAVPPVEIPSIDAAMRQDPTLRSFGQRGEPPHVVPWMWYEAGIPNSAWGLRRACEITGFRGIPDHPAYGTWSLADVESTLRSHGPFVFFGYWNGFPHAMVVAGADQAAGTVAFMDPVQGFVHSEPLATFNNRMQGMTVAVQANRYNPIHYPTSKPVRATISSD